LLRRRRGKGRRRLRRAEAQKVCRFCSKKIENIDFKDTQRLTNYLTERGKILPSRISGNCRKHQRQLSTAIKRAREAALLPFKAE